MPVEMLLNCTLKFVKQALYRACLFLGLFFLGACESDKPNNEAAFWLNAQKDSLIVKGEQQNYAVAIKKYQNIVILNNTAVEYLNQINIQKNIKAVADWNSLQKFYPNWGNIINISSEQALSTEQLWALQPDLIIVNDYQYKNYAKLHQQLNFLVMEEYKVPTLQQKVEYIKIFGALFQKENEANAYFKQEERALQNIDFLSNSTLAQLDCYNGNYFLPTCNSPLAHYLLSKNIRFSCLNNTLGTEIPKEKAQEVVVLNDYFLVIDWDKNRVEPKEIIASWNIQIPKDKKIIYCNAVLTNYFLKMAVQPSVLLKDLQLVLDTQKDGKYFKLFGFKGN